MKIPRISRVLLTATAIVLVTAATSQAAPVVHGFSVTAPCDDGRSLDVIVPPGRGTWTSGVVIDGRGTFKVDAFTFSDTAADGSVDGPYTDPRAGGAVASHNPHPTVTCTQTAPDGNGGTITLDIVGFFTA